MFRQVAIKRSGGSAAEDMSGRHRLLPALPAAAVPSVLGKRSFQEKMTWKPSFPKSPGNGIRQKNGSITPRQVSPNSNRKVWWTCDLGHDYQAVIAARTARGSGCPYCSGRRVLSGFNDLATLEPEIAKQWHRILNGSFTP